MIRLAMCAKETLRIAPVFTGAILHLRGIMIERGLYFAKGIFKDLIRSVGGEWNDKKQRPMVCLIKSSECDDLYWAIPMGDLNHRTQEQIDRINKFLSYPERDIRSCYYHVANTTTNSIFFISDAIPISDKYIDREYTYGGTHYIIKNPKVIEELERKLFRILAIENSSPNKFRQHITSVKNRILEEISNDHIAQGNENQVDS